MASLATTQVRTKVVAIAQKVVVADQSVKRITNNIYVQRPPAHTKPKTQRSERIADYNGGTS